MGIDTAPKKALLFNRTKKCIICSLYSVAIKPGMYYVARESDDVNVTSNNPNQVFKSLNSTAPTAKALAIDTAGFSINEAIAFEKIDLQKAEDQISILLASGIGQIVKAPRNLIDLLPALAEKVELTDFDTVKRLQPNKKWHRWLIRLLTGLRLGLAYSLLMTPLMLLNFQFTLRSMLVLTGSMILASVFFPRNRLWNLIVFLFSGVVMSIVVSLLGNSSFDLANFPLILLIGVLWGFTAWIILNR